MILSSLYLNTKDFLQSAVENDAQDSLLSRNESNAVKGLLICLIVLGHNKYLMQGGMSNLYLYSFHVYAFYYLPFLYNFKHVGIGQLLRRNFIRFYVPYTVIFALLLCIGHITGHLSSLRDTAAAFICGSQYMLYNTLGFGSFLWFIPTMFSVLLYRWIYYNLGVKWRYGMLILSGICLIGFAYMIPTYVTTWIYSPMCLTVALGMVLPAVILREVFRRLEYAPMALAFFMLTVALMIVYPVKDIYPDTYLTINRLICPILIFSLLLSIRQFLSKKQIFIDLGKESFKIYLIHIFIYNGIYLLADRYSPGIYAGFAVYIIGLSVAYAISKIPLLRYVFPK